MSGLADEDDELGVVLDDAVALDVLFEDGRCFAEEVVLGFFVLVDLALLLVLVGGGSTTDSVKSVIKVLDRQLGKIALGATY